MPTEQKDLQVTSASEWGKQAPAVEEGFITELPTGNVIRMRRTMDMLVLLRTGQIPNPLAGIVKKMIDSGDPNFPTDNATASAYAPQLLDLLDRTWMKAVIEPVFDAPPPQGKDENGLNIEEDDDQYIERIARWRPKDGAISVFDVDVNDKLYVLIVAQGAAADLAKFREVTDESLASVQASPGVPKPTKRTSGSRSKK